jgi:flagellar assembly protein FliH
VIDDVFEPFVPRRIERHAATASSAPPAVAAIAPEPEPPAQDIDDALPAVFVPPQPDPLACSAAVRAMAIRLASAACARALREAVARNPLFVARFVDEALRAAADPVDASVRLNPSDARLCAGFIPCDTIADAGLERGQVIVQAGSGAIEATIDERASTLVRAFASE